MLEKMREWNTKRKLEAENVKKGVEDDGEENKE